VFHTSLNGLGLRELFVESFCCCVEAAVAIKRGEK
jgi:hypothetical protein